MRQQRAVYGSSPVFLVAVLTLLFASGPEGAAAQDATSGPRIVGRLVYLEGDVELIRDGALRDASGLGPGTTIREFDVLQTGFDGYAEVELSAPSASLVRVRENSAYYVERSGDGGATTTLRLLNGRVDMAVEQMTGGARLQVNTGSAVLGVRGTSFDVLSSPDDYVLFGVREGSVEIAAGGRRISTGAGTAVEAAAERGLSRETVAGDDFEAYYERWTRTRLQAFRSGAATFIRAYVRRYQDTRPAFDEAYTQLMDIRPRLEEAARGSGSLGSDMQLRAAASPMIIRMRSILPLFESTVYRLRELDRFHAQGLGRTRIGTTSSEDFFRSFAMQEGDLLRRLTEVRTVFALFREIEERSFGGLPGASGDDSPFGGGSLLDSMRF